MSAIGPGDIPDSVKERLLEATLKKVRSIAEGIRNRTIGVSDLEKELKESVDRLHDADWKFYKRLYPRWDRMRTIALEGLKLRRLAGDQPAAHSRRRIISASYGVDGLHAAQAVQTRAPIHIANRLQEIGQTQAEIDRQVRDFLANIELRARFVLDTDAPKSVAEEILRDLALKPPAYLLAGSGAAEGIARKVAELLDGVVVRQSYVPEPYDSPKTFNLLLRKKDLGQV